jgi:uncharacterized membrane protein (UPF0127 family)
MPLRTFPVLVVVLVSSVCSTGCTEERKTATLDDLYTRQVRLPDGTVFKCEAAIRPFELARGLMFRDSLPPDRGMLFINPKPGKYPFFLYQVKIPLDIIWMDPNRLITEIIANAPPCTLSSASKCPQYGGSRPSQFILELNAGMAAKHELTLGDRIDF